MLKAEKPEKAGDILRKALELDPDSERAMELLTLADRAADISKKRKTWVRGLMDIQQGRGLPVIGLNLPFAEKLLCEAANMDDDMKDAVFRSFRDASDQFVNRISSRIGITGNIQLAIVLMGFFESDAVVLLRERIDDLAEYVHRKIMKDFSDPKYLSFFVESLYFYGCQSFAFGHMQKALDVFGLVLKSFAPGSVDTRYLESVHYYASAPHFSGQHKEAEENLNDLIRSIEAINEKSPAGKLAETIAHHEKGVSIFNVGHLTSGTSSPVNPESVVGKDIDRFPDGFSVMSDQLRALLSESYGILGLAILAGDKQRTKEAKQCCQRAVMIDPENPIVWNNLGLVLSETGEKEEAKIAFRKGVELNSFGAVFLNLASMIAREASSSNDMTMKEDLSKEAVRLLRASLEADKSSALYPDLYRLLIDMAFEGLSGAFELLGELAKDYRIFIIQAIERLERDGNSDIISEKVRRLVS